MPIDPTRAIGATTSPWSAPWTPADVILYHLGVGAGVDGPTSAAELAYTYERDLQVLPSYATAPAFRVVPEVNDFDGIDIDWGLVLHGSHELVVHRTLPPATTARHQAHVAEVWDKGKAAVIVLEVETNDDGGPLCTNRFTLFARGAGGFGGAPGPAGAPDHLPDRSPDLVRRSATTPHQALLYRLSGDLNPLHVDPDAASAAGFATPILHGLCSFGIVCKAVVDAALDGDTSRVGSYAARFAGVVFPGESIETTMWRTDDQITISASTVERSSPVLTQATMRLR